MILDNRIRTLRFLNGETSQDELAKALGVTRQTIYYIEKGKVMPSVLLAFKIASYFKKSVEDVFFIRTNNQTSNEIQRNKLID